MRRKRQYYRQWDPELQQYWLDEKRKGKWENYLSSEIRHNLIGIIANNIYLNFDFKVLIWVVWKCFPDRNF